MHEKVHSDVSESRTKVRTVRSLKIASRRLGITGKTDAVEFYADGKIVPVEYKRGRPKHDTSDAIQVCAEAMALEEMLGCKITEAALFYFATRKRIALPLDEKIRSETIAFVQSLHEFIARGKTPPAQYEKRCDACSLADICFPKSCARKKSVALYIKRRLMSDGQTEDGQTENVWNDF